MKHGRYRCLPSYQCECPKGALISLTTVRRHRDIAQERARLQTNNPYLSFSLPPQTLVSYESNQKVSNEKSDSISGSNSGIAKSLNSAVVHSDLESSHVESDSLLSNSSSITPESIEDVVYWNKVETYDKSSYADIEVSGGETLSDFPIFACKDETDKDLSHDESELNYSTDELVHTDNELSSSEGEGNISNDISILRLYGWHCRYYLRYNLTNSAMDHLIKRDYPDGIKSWKTVVRRVQVLSGIQCTTHKYCGAGHELIENVTNGNGCSHPDCQTAPAPVKSLKYINLKERLVGMLGNKELGPEIVSYVQQGYLRQKRDEEGDLEDFYSGTGFRSYVDGIDGFETDNRKAVHLFLFISTDGAPAFRSSNQSFWPILVYIGNIPPHKRYQEEFIFPISCIPGNPTNLESFMSPLFDELEELQNGTKVTLWDGSSAIMHCHLLHELSDLQARRKLCLLKGVNGYCPCAYCSIRGVRKELGNTVYYPNYITVKKRKRTGDFFLTKKNLWKPSALPMRDELETKNQFKALEELRSSGTKQQLNAYMKDTGIIGQAQLFMRFTSMTPYLSLPVDLMHLLFENVAPFMLKIWMGEVDTEDEHCYLAEALVIRQVNQTLANAGRGIDPSIRRPRDLTQKGSWKADEWRTFVATTSLIALHELLPSNILKGWWMFCQICDLSMRPRLLEVDIQRLSSLCVSFFDHFSFVYYRGLESRLHLMRYTMHLILHIPTSTSFCGPLICLSQFATERFIGVVKGSVHAKYRFAESTINHWMFEQAFYLCQRKCFDDGNANGSNQIVGIGDRRSKYSNQGFYEGFFLKGPVIHSSILKGNKQNMNRIISGLIRYYSADLDISIQEAKKLIRDNGTFHVWERLAVQRSDEWVPRMYRKFSMKNERSAAFFAGVFRNDETQSLDVYYGKVECFLEHAFINPRTKQRDHRILVSASWASRGLQVGEQNQVFGSGSICSQSLFPVFTIEDVRCIARNVAVIETIRKRGSIKRLRTYFVDDQLDADGLLSSTNDGEDQNFKLQGI